MNLSGVEQIQTITIHKSSTGASSFRVDNVYGNFSPNFYMVSGLTVGAGDLSNVVAVQLREQSQDVILTDGGTDYYQNQIFKWKGGPIPSQLNFDILNVADRTLVTTTAQLTFFLTFISVE